MQTIEDMKQRLLEVRTELPEAKTAARREKANAHVEDREPDPAVMNRPAELETEIRDLPDDIYASEIKSAQAKKAAAEKRIEDEEAKREEGRCRARA